MFNMVTGAGQRHEGEELGVHVVFDVEMSWESGTREVIFVPGAVVLLVAD